MPAEIRPHVGKLVGAVRLELTMIPAPKAGGIAATLRSGIGAPDEDRTRLYRMDSAAPSPAGSGRMMLTIAAAARGPTRRRSSLVGTQGIEPVVYRLRAGSSAIELHPRDWSSRDESNVARPVISRVLCH